MVAIKEGRYLEKEGVYKIEARQMKDETIEQTNKNMASFVPKKPGDLVRLRSEEKPMVESSSQSKISAPDTPPNSPPKMRQPSQEFGSPENFRSSLSPISSNHLLTPPNLTPPVTGRPYFKKMEKNGKKLNFTVEQ